MRKTKLLIISRILEKNVVFIKMFGTKTVKVLYVQLCVGHLEVTPYDGASHVHHKGCEAVHFFDCTNSHINLSVSQTRLHEMSVLWVEWKWNEGSSKSCTFPPARSRGCSWWNSRWSLFTGWFVLTCGPGKSICIHSKVTVIYTI